MPGGKVFALLVLPFLTGAPDATYQPSPAPTPAPIVVKPSTAAIDLSQEYSRAFFDVNIFGGFCDVELPDDEVIDILTHQLEKARAETFGSSVPTVFEQPLSVLLDTCRQFGTSERCESKSGVAMVSGPDMERGAGQWREQSVKCTWKSPWAGWGSERYSRFRKTDRCVLEKCKDWPYYLTDRSLDPTLADGEKKDFCFNGVAHRTCREMDSENLLHSSRAHSCDGDAENGCVYQAANNNWFLQVFWAVGAIQALTIMIGWCLCLKEQQDHPHQIRNADTFHMMERAFQQTDAIGPMYLLACMMMYWLGTLITTANIISLTNQSHGTDWDHLFSIAAKTHGKEMPFFKGQDDVQVAMCGEQCMYGRENKCWLEGNNEAFCEGTTGRRRLPDNVAVTAATAAPTTLAPTTVADLVATPAPTLYPKNDSTTDPEGDTGILAGNIYTIYLTSVLQLSLSILFPFVVWYQISNDMMDNNGCAKGVTLLTIGCWFLWFFFGRFIISIVEANAAKNELYYSYYSRFTVDDDPIHIYNCAMVMVYVNFIPASTVGLSWLGAVVIKFQFLHKIVKCFCYPCIALHNREENRIIRRNELNGQKERIEGVVKRAIAALNNGGGIPKKIWSEIIKEPKNKIKVTDGKCLCCSTIGAQNMREWERYRDALDNLVEDEIIIRAVKQEAKDNRANARRAYYPEEPAGITKPEWQTFGELIQGISQADARCHEIILECERISKNLRDLEMPPRRFVSSSLKPTSRDDEKEAGRIEDGIRIDSKNYKSVLGEWEEYAARCQEVLMNDKELRILKRGAKVLTESLEDTQEDDDEKPLVPPERMPTYPDTNEIREWEDYIRKLERIADETKRYCPICSKVSLLYRWRHCQHAACKDCSRKIIVDNYKNRQKYPFRCFNSTYPDFHPTDEPNTGLLVDSKCVLTLLSKDEHQVFDRMCVSTSVPDDQLFSCPKCNYPHIKADPGQTLGKTTCENQDCSLVFCAECQVEWHSNETCLERRQKISAMASKSGASNALMKNLGRNCPHCGVGPQVHYRGHQCHTMTCFKCKKQFCAVCGKPYPCSCAWKGHSFCNAKSAILKAGGKDCGCPPCMECKKGTSCAFCDGCPRCKPQDWAGSNKPDAAFYRQKSFQDTIPTDIKKDFDMSGGNGPIKARVRDIFGQMEKGTRSGKLNLDQWLELGRLLFPNKSPLEINTSFERLADGKGAAKFVDYENVVKTIPERMRKANNKLTSAQLLEALFFHRISHLQQRGGASGLLRHTSSGFITGLQRATSAIPAFFRRRSNQPET